MLKGHEWMAQPARETQGSLSDASTRCISASARCPGALVGFTLGLVGGGGSILAVPLMVYLVGVKEPARRDRHERAGGGRQCRDRPDQPRARRQRATGAAA